MFLKICTHLMNCGYIFQKPRQSTVETVYNVLLLITSLNWPLLEELGWPTNCAVVCVCVDFELSPPSFLLCQIYTHSSSGSTVNQSWVFDSKKEHMPPLFVCYIICIVLKYWLVYNPTADYSNTLLISCMKNYYNIQAVDNQHDDENKQVPCE